MKRMDKVEPITVLNNTYYPIASSATPDRAYEEARLFRRLGYRAQVRVCHNENVQADRYIVIVAKKYVYNSVGI